MIAITRTNRLNSWTGTRGLGCQLCIMHEPDEDQEARIAHAALSFIVENFGSEEAQQMTLAQMIECLVDLG